MTSIADLGAHRASAIGCDLVADKRKDAHTVRVPEPGRWEAFDANTRRQSTNPTSVLNAFLGWYNRDPGARLPQRLEDEHTTRSADLLPPDLRD